MFGRRNKFMYALWIYKNLFRRLGPASRHTIDGSAAIVSGRSQESDISLTYSVITNVTTTTARKSWNEIVLYKSRIK